MLTFALILLTLVLMWIGFYLVLEAVQRATLRRRRATRLKRRIDQISESA